MAKAERLVPIGWWSPNVNRASLQIAGADAKLPRAQSAEREGRVVDCWASDGVLGRFRLECLASFPARVWLIDLSDCAMSDAVLRLSGIGDTEVI